MNKKHASKLYLGFCKMYKRQSDKPKEKRIFLKNAIKLPKNFKGDYNHYLDVSNSIWNGINLVQVMNRTAPKTKIGGMYSKFIINKEGKYILSFYGKQCFKKKTAKKCG